VVDDRGDHTGSYLCAGKKQRYHLGRFYNRVVSRKPQEIDQLQSNVKRIVDYDWLISCGLRLASLL